jgi:hypothetical protein
MTMTIPTPDQTHAGSESDKKVEFREWTIDSRPNRIGHHRHSWWELERRPTDEGQTSHFSDIGYFDTKWEAYQRACRGRRRGSEKTSDLSDERGQGLCDWPPVILTSHLS